MGALRWSLLALAALGSGACFVETVRGSGEAATESREVGPFTALHNATFLEVALTLSESQAVSVTCDDNLLPYITTLVSGEELVIEQRITGERPDTYVSLEPRVACSAEVAATTLRRLNSSGSGGVEGVGPFDALAAIVNSGSGAVGVDGLQVAELAIGLSGAGPIAVSGTAGHLVVQSSGAGKTLARALPAQDADVTMSGSGDVEVTVSGCLNASISGSGDLYVAGGAELCQVESPGEGQVIVQ